MSNIPRQTDSTCRAPNCVSEVRKDYMILIVSGCLKHDAAETAASKTSKVIAA